MVAIPPKALTPVMYQINLSPGFMRSAFLRCRDFIPCSLKPRSFVFLKLSGEPTMIQLAGFELASGMVVVSFGSRNCVAIYLTTERTRCDLLARPDEDLISRWPALCVSTSTGSRIIPILSPQERSQQTQNFLVDQT